MSYLVLPTAHNLISAQTLLDDPKFIASTGNPTDDATLKKISEQLLETIAFQSASLDLINGFVETQQMGKLQHAGRSISRRSKAATRRISRSRTRPTRGRIPTPPACRPNPYAFDPATIPGLAVGYNPITQHRRRNAVAAGRDAKARGCRRQNDLRRDDPVSEIKRVSYGVRRMLKVVMHRERSPASSRRCSHRALARADDAGRDYARVQLHL